MKVVRLFVIEVRGEGCEQLMGTDVARLFPLLEKNKHDLYTDLPVLGMVLLYL